METRNEVHRRCVFLLILNQKNMADLTDIQRSVHKLAKDKGWWDKVNDLSAIPTENVFEKLFLIQSEISEAGEELRSGKGFTEIYQLVGSDKPEGFPIELADAVIRILDLCEVLGVNLEEALIMKHGYNSTRPHRHGNKIA